MRTLSTYARIYEPASNIERNQEDGCMKKIRIERSLKLREEDDRSKGFNPLTNNQNKESTWLDSFGKQKDTLLKVVEPSVKTFHNEKANIASSLTEGDIANEAIRVNMNYASPKKITHESSVRYKHNPKDS